MLRCDCVRRVIKRVYLETGYGAVDLRLSYDVRDACMQAHGYMMHGAAMATRAAVSVAPGPAGKAEETPSEGKS